MTFIGWMTQPEQNLRWIVLLLPLHLALLSTFGSRRSLAAAR